MKKLIKNYTTDIPVEKTITEIQKILSQNGATGIATEYDKGRIRDIFFKIKVAGKELAFGSLPNLIKSMLPFMDKQ